MDTSRQTKNLNKLLIRILLHLQVEFSLDFSEVNGKTYNASTEYKIAFICTSSKKGDAYEGAPNSTLMLDDLKITFEK